MGVSASDIKILSDNVSIVFHSAATVKFDQTLKSAVEMNLKGTMHVIQLIRKLRHLDVSYHYCQHFFCRFYNLCYLRHWSMYQQPTPTAIKMKSLK